jgi:hypothetical protein
MLAQECFQKNVIMKRVAGSDKALSWVKPRRRAAPYRFTYAYEFQWGDQP